MPTGMRTVEFIPNWLQEEWTEAWNAVYRLRDATSTEEDRERALKWILRLPEGLLHSPRRGGKNGARQYKDMARRFLMWRQRDMMDLMKTWKAAAVVAEKRLSKAESRKDKGNQTRVARAILLIRKGAISREGKALESKGMGDKTNEVIWNQMRVKHPTRKK